MTSLAITNRVRKLRAAKAQIKALEGVVKALTAELVPLLADCKTAYVDDVPATLCAPVDTVYSLSVLKANLSPAQYRRCIKETQNLAAIREMVKDGTISASLDMQAKSTSPKAKYIL